MTDGSQWRIATTRLSEERFQVERAVLVGDPSQPPSDALWAESQRVGHALLRNGAGFPPALYASGRIWNDESVQDAVSGWTTDRLVERGQLRAIALKSATVIRFRGQLEGSLRQHLIGEQERSQSKNLFRRVRQTLEEDNRFECTVASARASRSRYRLVGTDAVFAGDERRLAAAAWAAGDFPAKPWRDDAEKLSPVLEGQDLADFLAGLLLASGEATVSEVITAMDGRYNLGAPDFDVDAVLSSEIDRPEVEVERNELAEAMIARLTPRQLLVLQAHQEELNGREIAARLECSPGTISAEFAAIRRALDAARPDAAGVLKDVLDRVFKRAV